MDRIREPKLEVIFEEEIEIEEESREDFLEQQTTFFSHAIKSIIQIKILSKIAHIKMKENIK